VQNLTPIAPANSFVHDAWFQRVQLGTGGPAANPGYSPSLSPVSAEVVACAKVPLFASVPFIGTAKAGPTYTVVGRAAARTIPALEEWFVPGSPTPGHLAMWTNLGGIGMQPYEPAPGADQLSTDMNRALWDLPNFVLGAVPQAADHFDVDFSGFPVWNNPNANGGAGGYNRSYATGDFMPVGTVNQFLWGHTPSATSPRS
jgi:hypothetical protein